MILTPLQALTVVAFTVSLCAVAMILIHRYMPLRNKTLEDLQDQITALDAEHSVLDGHIGMLKYRIQRLDGATEIHFTPEDPMALWDTIVNDAKKHEN